MKIESGARGNSPFQGLGLGSRGNSPFQVMAALVVVAVMMALAAPAVQAQQYARTAFPAGLASTGAALNGGTNTVPALRTNTYIIPLTKYGDVALDVGFTAFTASSTSNLVYSVWESGTTNKPTATGARWIIPVAANSTTAVRYPATNLTVGASGYLIVEVANTNASGVMTNVAGYYVLKPSRFGN